MGPARRQCYKVIRFEKSMFFVIFNTPLKSVSFKKPVEISWVLEISTGFLKETDFSSVYNGIERYWGRS